MIKVGKINIVGVDYDLIFHDNFKEINEAAKERDKKYGAETKDEQLDGWTDYTTKELHVFRDDTMAEDYFNMTLLHEITHAFLFEIGNTHHTDEELIDKLSKWVPMLNKLYIKGKEKLDGIDTRNNQQDQPDQQGNNESGIGIQ